MCHNNNYRVILRFASQMLRAWFDYSYSDLANLQTIRHHTKNMDSMLKPFIPQKASFGRHETFALRYAWLTKGFQAHAHNSDIFSSDEATIELGVGKNMVNAIKYWLRAASLIEDSADGLCATPIATAIFSEQGYDPYLEDEVTIWLIHWLLATNFESATAWYWFFNCFHKSEFTSEEASEALADFVRNNVSGKHSERTVKQEIPLILRMYSPAKAQIEDSLDAPLISLKLITAVDGSHVYQSFSGQQANLPIEIIGYASNEVFNQRNTDVLPISDLMYGQKYGVALGSVFRLTESALLAKLEQLVARYPNVFHINETAGIHQFSRLTDSQSLDFLGHYYQGVTL